MSQDVSAEVAGLISSAKVFGASDNIRHGKYLLLIKRIHARLVENDAGNHRMAFWEFTVLESAPNPQVEGDRVDYVSPQQPGTGPLKDDGNKPNLVGSSVALKVDFDGPGGRSAGANIKDAILALFNKHDGEISDKEVDNTWLDLSRVKDVRQGETIGFNQQTNTVIIADKDKRANPACGMVIRCSTMVKRKKKANEKGAYITRLVWHCAAPIGTGMNAPELVAKRRLEIEAAQSDDEEEETTSTPAAPAQQVAQMPAQAPVQTPPAAPAPPPPVAAAPPPPSAAFVPTPPWQKHTDPRAANGPTPETRWYWNPTTNEVKNEVQLRG